MRLDSRLLALGLAAGFLLALAPSCSPGHCQLGDCAGCCTSEGVCMMGTVGEFCGLNGAACQVCGSGQSCSGSGVCVDPYGNPGTGGANAGTGGGGGGGGTITCSGCIRNGQCIVAPDNATPSLCGTKGQQCQDCAQFGEVCSNYQCVPNTGTCGDGCIRGDGSCAHAPDNALSASCGPPGTGCQVCASGMTCQGYQCRPSGGGGGPGGGPGGGTGGGASGGTGGGATGGCYAAPPIGPFNPSRGFHALDAGFGRSDWGARIVASGSMLGPGVADVVAIDRYATPLRPALFPRSVLLGPTTRGTCMDCVHYGVDCNLDAGVCARLFLAQSGTMSYSSGTDTVVGGVSTSGAFSGSAMSLHFVEWNVPADVPLTGGACVDLPNMGWNAKWP